MTNVSIKKNKFISVIGTQSGKSIIMIILGLLEPVKGDVHYHSSIIENKTNRPNGYVLSPKLIQLNNIALGVDEKNVNEKDIKAIKISQLNDLLATRKRY